MKFSAIIFQIRLDMFFDIKRLTKIKITLQKYLICIWSYKEIENKFE